MKKPDKSDVIDWSQIPDDKLSDAFWRTICDKVDAVRVNKPDDNIIASDYSGLD